MFAQLCQSVICVSVAQSEEFCRQSCGSTVNTCDTAPFHIHARLLKDAKPTCVDVQHEGLAQCRNDSMHTIFNKEG